MGAKASKHPLKTSQEPVPGSQVFLELEPAKEIYKNGSKEPEAKPFLEEVRAESHWKKEPAPQHCILHYAFLNFNRINLIRKSGFNLIMKGYWYTNTITKL